MLLSLREQRPTFRPSQGLVDKLNSILIGGIDCDKFADIEENVEDIDNDDLPDSMDVFNGNASDEILDNAEKCNFDGPENQDPVIIKIKKPSEVKKVAKSQHELYPGGICGICGELILPVKRILDHLKNVHDVEYKCSKCGKRLSSEKKLEMHLFHRHRIGDYRPPMPKILLTGRISSPQIPQIPPGVSLIHI